MAVQKCHDMMNSSQHIDKIMVRQSSKVSAKNRLKLRVSIEAVRFCAFQVIAFRGHNESVESQNRGNFLELVKHTSAFNDEVAAVVLGNALQNASYVSPLIQKELSIYASKVQEFIRSEIGGEKFCIIVDESRDESGKEQVAIILRFVDKKGFVQERFFDIVNVDDTKASTLKQAICKVLSYHQLSIQNIRGQGYDGASNMRGEWNGLQALFFNDCPYAYYIYCFAHRLQLVLVATVQSLIPIENFFSIVTTVINLVSSFKRLDQLQSARALQLKELIDNGELETGKGKNQIDRLQRPGDTRCSSHLKSLMSLHKMFGPVLNVLENIVDDKGSTSSRSSAKGAWK